jgi:hypothetical protein
MNENLNRGFDIPLGELEEKIGAGINRDLQRYGRIIPLKEISRINHIAYFKEDVFDALIRKIPLRGTDIFPYKDSRIKTFNRDSEGLEIGQTFVLRKKILSIMEAFSKGKGHLFEGFISNGLSKMTPLQVYGVDMEGNRAIAFYVPSIVEIHNDSAILIDGIHRATICNAGGTSTKAIHIQDVNAKLPFDPILWGSAEMVDVKPPINERYVNLRKEFFRDLSAVGIDG